MSPGHNMGLVLRKGAWTAQEDTLLKNHIQKYGEGKWHLVPLKAGLNRCRKSCRLRWLNYLKPDIKRGDFEEDEVDLILRLHKLLGNRWSLIAGRIPGRTANDVKNYWNTHVRSRPKRQKDELKDGEQPQQAMVSVIRPQPRTLSKTLNMYPRIEAHDAGNFETLSNDGFSNAFNISQGLASAPRVFENKINEYVDELFVDFGKEKDNEVGWTMRGVTVEEKGLDVDEQEDGLNSLLDIPMDDGIWDLLGS